MFRIVREVRGEETGAESQSRITTITPRGGGDDTIQEITDYS